MKTFVFPVSPKHNLKNEQQVFSSKNIRILPKKHQQKLFGRFARDETSKREVMGTGLGLYIAKEIVKAHNGEIWAESEGIGKGSKFFVRLGKG